jgi:hypothetical protein
MDITAKGVRPLGIDYAWEHPAISALENWGAAFVCRYVSPDSGKNETLAEAQALAGHGIWSVLVWEASASRALAGRSAGAEDARRALALARTMQMPEDRPIYFAVDFDATSGQQAAINAYLDGAASILGKSRVGIYGGYNPVRRALDGGHCKWAWQTYAWSGGKWDSRAQLQQYHNDIRVGGIAVDANRATVSDYGQWKPRVSPTPAPPKPDSTDTEELMPSGLLADGQKAITPISLPRGKFKTIGFIADNGLQGLPPAQLRVAVHQGAGHWDTATYKVDSAKGQTVVTFSDQANTDGISVQRLDAGDVHVAYEVS